MFEGGVRVPWIVLWPGHVAANRVDDKSVISGIDFLPTLCAITGVEINATDFDGEDTSSAWLGQREHVRTRPLMWKTSSVNSDAGIREGQWKLIHLTLSISMCSTDSLQHETPCRRHRVAVVGRHLKRW